MCRVKVFLHIAGTVKDASLVNDLQGDSQIPSIKVTIHWIENRDYKD